jgi:hypothetical protein
MDEVLALAERLNGSSVDHQEALLTVMKKKMEEELANISNQSKNSDLQKQCEALEAQKNLKIAELEKTRRETAQLAIFEQRTKRFVELNERKNSLEKKVAKMESDLNEIMTAIENDTCGENKFVNNRKINRLTQEFKIVKSELKIIEEQLLST